MELAVAKYSFEAAADDELSFSEGSTLKILSKDRDPWYKAECNGKEGYVPKNYIEMKPHSLGSSILKEVSRTEAENLLLEKNGSEYKYIDMVFLIRPSETSPGDFMLSVKFEGQVQHFKILRDGDGKFFMWVAKFDSFTELVRYHRTHSVSRTQTIYLVDMD